MVAGGQVDGLVEEFDQRHVGDLVGAWFQAPVGAVAGQVDHAHGLVRVRGSRVLGAPQTPQMNGQGVRGRRPRRQGDHLAHDPPAYELCSDTAACPAIGDRGRHDHEDLAAGLGVRIGVLEPRQLPFGLGRGAEFPAGVEQQFLPPPLGHAGRRVADDQVRLEIRPFVRAQGVTCRDAHVRSAQEIGAELREAGTVGIRLLAAAARSRFGGDGQEQHPDAAGGIEHRGVGPQFGSEVTHGTHHALGRHLVRARTPSGVHESFRQCLHQVDGRFGPGELLHTGGDVIRQAWLTFSGQRQGHLCQTRDHLFPVGSSHGLPQLDLGRHLLAFSLLVQPFLDLGERIERTVRGTSRRRGEVVVAPTPIRDSGPSDSGQPGNLGTGNKRAYRWGGIVRHPSSVHEMQQ
ncbi:hypothetical protein SHIRM173S_00852 [Streptomyces hirsutus]